MPGQVNGHGLPFTVVQKNKKIEGKTVRSGFVTLVTVECSSQDSQPAWGGDPVSWDSGKVEFYTFKEASRLGCLEKVDPGVPVEGIPAPREVCRGELQRGLA